MKQDIILQIHRENALYGIAGYRRDKFRQADKTLPYFDESAHQKIVLSTTQRSTSAIVLFLLHALTTQNKAIQYNLHPCCIKKDFNKHSVPTVRYK